MQPLIQTPHQQLEAAIAALDAGHLYKAASLSYAAAWSLSQAAANHSGRSISEMLAMIEEPDHANR